MLKREQLSVGFAAVLFPLRNLQQQFALAVPLGLAAGASAGSLVSAVAILVILLLNFYLYE